MEQRKPKTPPSPEQQARNRKRAVAHDMQKEKMLFAAARLFCEKGFVGTTLDEIAARVELKKPRLYFHFKNKQEILKDCLDRALSQWHAAMNQIQKCAPDGVTLRLIVERYADIAFGHFGFCAIFVDINSLAPNERDLFLRQQADVDAGFKSLFANAIPGEIRSSPDPELLWLIATSLVHGIALLKNPPVGKEQILSKALATDWPVQIQMRDEAFSLSALSND